MSILLGADEIRKQSLAVYKQFEKLWKKNAGINSKLERSNMKELEHMGVGKFCLLIAMGSSVEDNIETIKKYRDRIDVVCCDKSFGPLLEHGVKADMVVIADAGIPYKFIEKWIDKTEGVKLFMTPYANPEWTTKWKGPRYCYLNQDAIGTERVFMPYMGYDQRIIPASSNVSNAMFVMMTDCDEKKNVNWAGYEHYFLVGYDYSWPAKGNYYAWDNPIPKRYYLNHRTLPVSEGIAFSSENLIFSAKWLVSYVSSFQLPVTNCSGRGILDIGRNGNLEEELSHIRPKKEFSQIIKDDFEVMKNSHVAFKNTEKNFYLHRRLLWQ